MSDPTARFSDRVDNYVRFRPGYPAEALDCLIQACRLARTDVVADIGSGTGIFSELLLRNGNRVIGVEPNAQMRSAAERLLSGYPLFVSREGRAEQTGLDDSSVELVTAAQAYHWFEPRAARREFARILKPGGGVALVWNERLTTGSAFLEGYEELLRTYALDYEQVNHTRVASHERIAEFFAPAACSLVRLPNRQELDRDALAGRLLSSSYVSGAGHPRHEPMMKSLAALFERTSREGRVTVEYQTLIYTGRLS